MNINVAFIANAIEQLTEEERVTLFKSIKHLLPGKTEPGLCIDGKGHNYQAIRTTNYLFDWLNKTQFFCKKCKDIIWR